MRGTNFKSQHGHVTTTIVSVVLMLSVLGVIVASIVSSDRRGQMFEADEQRAFYAAQSGLEYGIKKYVADPKEDPDEFEIDDLDLGDGVTADVAMTKVGSNQVKFTATGKTGGISQTLHTTIFSTDSSYVPNYAVYSGKSVFNTVAKSDPEAEANGALIFQNAGAVPYFDLNELRAIAKSTHEDDNSYYYDGNLSVTNDFNPPDGTIVFVEGDLSFVNGSWENGVHFVAMGNIIFKPAWKNSSDVSMTIYQPNYDKKIYVEEKVEGEEEEDEEDKEPVDFDIDDGEIIPEDEFAASLSVLGAALQDVHNGELYNAPVTFDFKVGKDKLRPFGPNPSASDKNKDADLEEGNLNIPGNSMTFYFDQTYNAGDKMDFKARSWFKNNGKGGKYKMHQMAHSSKKKDFDIVWLLRNGDYLPDLPAFKDQASAIDFIEPYVNFSNQKVVLTDNQVLILFELSTRDTDAEDYDLQDLILLVNLGHSVDEISDTPIPDDAEIRELTFKGGIISHGNIEGSAVEHEDDKEHVNQLNVIHDKDLVRDFMQFSINGGSRVILSSQWKAIN